jgi:hypothetical protein
MMTRIAISDISLEENYLVDLSEAESAFVKGGLDYNSFLYGLAQLSTLIALQKINAIKTIVLAAIEAIIAI